MKLKMISWNVRGANSVDKRKMIMAFLKYQHAYLVYLQETKLKVVDHSVVHSLGVGRWLEWGAINAKGASTYLLGLKDLAVDGTRGRPIFNFPSIQKL